MNWEITNLKTSSELISGTIVFVTFNVDDQKSMISKTIKLNAPTEGKFTEFNEITEDKLISWVKDVLGDNGILELEKELSEKTLESNLEQKQVPWGRNEVTKEEYEKAKKEGRITRY
jgi:hypothetical protein